MKVNSSIIASFVVGAVIASLPFLVSRGPVQAQGPRTSANMHEAVVASDDDYIYVVSNGKIYKVLKSTVTVMFSSKLE